MTPFTQKVIQVIQQIPPGKVMTYGQVAATAGSPRAARQVVRILHSMSKKHQLPWHRIINAKGQISIQDDEGAALQKLYLESEGVDVSENGFISLEQFQYYPILESVSPDIF
ncbi:MAG TPA: MGMT family protein [Candidatus Bathyarchaeia archaeon]|nr:MGMT family protein [Candidatus Bathyarchaeia archaeon]